MSGITACRPDRSNSNPSDATVQSSDSQRRHGADRIVAVVVAGPFPELGFSDSVPALRLQRSLASRSNASGVLRRQLMETESARGHPHVRP